MSNPYIDGVFFERLSEEEWVPMVSFLTDYGYGVDPTYDGQTAPDLPPDPTTEITVRIRFIGSNGCPDGVTPAVTVGHYSFIGSSADFDRVATGGAPGVTPAWLHSYVDPVAECDAGGAWAGLRDAPPSSWLGSLRATKLCDCRWRLDVEYAAYPLMLNNPFIDYISFRIAEGGNPGPKERVRLMVQQPGRATYSLITAQYACEMDALHIDYIVYFDEFNGIPNQITRDNSCFAVPETISDICLVDGVAYGGAELSTKCSGLDSTSPKSAYNGGGSCGGAPVETPTPTPPMLEQTPAPTPSASLPPTAPVALTFTATNAAGASFAVKELFAGALVASGDVDSLKANVNAVSVGMDLPMGCYRVSVTSGDDPAALAWTVNGAGAAVGGGALDSADFAVGGALCAAGECMYECGARSLPAAAAAAAADGADLDSCSAFGAAVASTCAAKCTAAEQAAATTACYNSGCSDPRTTCGIDDAVSVTAQGRVALSVLLGGVSGADILQEISEGQRLQQTIALLLGVDAANVTVVAVDGTPLVDGAYAGSRRRARRQRRRRQQRRLQGGRQGQRQLAAGDFARVKVMVVASTAEDASSMAAAATSDSMQGLLDSLSAAAAAELSGATVSALIASSQPVYVLDFDAAAGGSDDESSGNSANGSSSSGRDGGLSSYTVAIAVAAMAVAVVLVLVGAAIVVMRRRRQITRALPIKPMEETDNDAASVTSVVPIMRDGSHAEEESAGEKRAILR
ncbi:unnamed protein product [Phaeothamnion confervicola]